MFILIFVFLIFKNEADQKNFSLIDCNEKIYNSNCSCNVNYTITDLVITCSDFLYNDEIKLPNISAKNVKVISGLKKWPNLQNNFINTTKLDFSYNQIDLIGDLSNCPNLEVLDCSHNRLINIPKNLYQVCFLVTLNLKYNLIEVLDMELFMSFMINATTHYFLGNIRFLYLDGNKIKLVNKMDLLIFGMPFLIQFDLSYNQITQINISSLSQFSFYINLVIRQKYDSNFIVNKFFSIDNNQYNKEQYYRFYISNNRIEYVNFGFMGLFMTLMGINANISIDYILVRFASIYLGANQIKCSCALFDDFYFLLNGPLNKSQYFKNLSQSSLASTECERSNNETVKLISELASGKLKRSQFCGMNNAIPHFLIFNHYFNSFFVLFILLVYFY